MTAIIPADELARANQLDTLGAILPPDRRDTLAQILTNEDVATLKHLLDKGLGPNTLRAMTSDLAYLAEWAKAATGIELPWPPPQPLLLKFIAQHLWDPARRAQDADHGMPDTVATALKSARLLRNVGPHAPATVRRRLALWATLCRWRGLIGPFDDPHVRTALRAAVRSSCRPRKRKSPEALTRDVLDKLLATCEFGTLADLRDRAILLVGFASGGRRRSEIARLRLDQIERRPPVPSEAPDTPPLPCCAIHLGRTKTESGDNPAHVLIIGRSVEALDRWIAKAAVKDGAVFRGIDRHGNIAPHALTPEAVNLIIKKRCRRAGLDPSRYSAHGLRSGYLTEAARQRIPLLEAMQQSRHRSVEQASVYYNEADRSRTQAVRLAE